jgi:molybdenum cofactor cytidylyltransferase
MGSPKQLLLYEGQTLLRRAVHAALSAGCQTMVVTGASSARMKEELAGETVAIVENTLWEEGVGSSVRCAIQHTPTDADAVLIMTVDQPLVSPELLKKIIEAYRAGGAAVVASRYAGTEGVPALFDRSLFFELLLLHGDTGAKEVIRRHFAQARLIDAPECAFDLDRPEDGRATGV